MAFKKDEKRLVDVYAKLPVTALSYPIAGMCREIMLTTDEILACIRGKAKVDVVLPNKHRVRIGFGNYEVDYVAKFEEERKAAIKAAAEAANAKLEAENENFKAEQKKAEETAKAKEKELAEAKAKAEAEAKKAEEDKKAEEPKGKNKK